MGRTVLLPPENGLHRDGTRLGGWWHTEDSSDRIVCDLCPRECHLKPGDKGFCFVRENIGGEMVLTTYGRSTGFCIDPIEKKPLNHFLPGTAILSFGTAGCNLGCKFCQNWDISKSREVKRLSELATPEQVAEAASQLGCRSVAFTYNDPVIWAEYAIDCARACHDRGLKTVAVTAAYITHQARGPFYEVMDAANVDLKAFTEDFYWKLTQSHIQPVLDTIAWLKNETQVWFELTNLLIPDANDSPDEIREMCDWVLQHVGDEVPVHFTAFHPDFRLKDRERTPHQTLLTAYQIAREQGIKYVYVGNVNDTQHQSTYCPHCQQLLIERDWHALGQYHLESNRCKFCRTEIAGLFETKPGDWGRKRLPVKISEYASALPIVNLSQKDTSMSTPSAAAVASGPQLSSAQQEAIHRLACEVIAAAVQHRQPRAIPSELQDAAAKPVMGAFVTLKRQGKLRSCCGFLAQTQSAGLLEAVQHAAKRTALEDNRFPPISPSELRYLSVDVQLLYNNRPMTENGDERVAAVEVGRHGLQIRRGQSAGLLLPVVPVENDWDSEEFLRQVCRKAGLPSTAWTADDVQLWTFEGHSIPGDFDPESLGPTLIQTSLLSAMEVQQLADHCRNNIQALVHGATPNYYLFGVPDGTAVGLCLHLTWPGVKEPPQVSKISLRPGMPIQATLQGLAEAAAGAIRGLDRALLQQLQVTLTIMTDPAMHGTVADPDLRGFEPARRAILVMEANRSCWVFDPRQTAEQLLEKARTMAQIRSPEFAPVQSVNVWTNAAAVSSTSVPRPQAGPGVRPPAVAGSFYPADASELSRTVDDCFAGCDAEPAAWPAVMVPHAGLRYSGKIAAATFKHVQIPDTVIVIGPKHTRLGVEWAVAPHQVWSLPTGEVQSDPELARKLAAAIDGLELDAAAHQQEHGIEVELPFLQRLAPTTKVVGITMGGGNLERCRRFAEGLAGVLRGLESMPLLVISSDMNHYAPDAENRRLDELALSQLDRFDFEGLYQTCQTHNISMCGMLPAVTILQTLKTLGTLSRAQRVGYATSADASGDTSRVVGYAGMLFG